MIKNYKFKTVIFLFSLTILSLFSFSTKVSASQSEVSSTYSSIQMTEEEILDFLINKGILIPDELINTQSFVKEISDLTRNIILEKGKVYTEDFILIQDFIYDYAGINFTALSMEQSYQSSSENVLKYNLVLHNGVWSNSGGDWSESYRNYNCYSYAIGLTEEFLSPGEISGHSYNNYTDISILAEYVKQDLLVLGTYGDVEVYDYDPSIEFWQTKICIRREFFDFHLMRYDNDGYWYHKPGGTAPLRYLHHPEDMPWKTEVSEESKCSSFNDLRDGEQYPNIYDSDIYYIVFGESPFITTINGNNVSINGIKSGVNLPSNLNIPSVLKINGNDYTVNSIGNSVFIDNSQLSQITIPSSVTSIGFNAFKNCPNLTINILGRNQVPSNWNSDWNSSNRPVMFNGVLCSHSNGGTYTSLQSFHTYKCNDCWHKTTTDHSYTVIGDHKVCACGFKLCANGHDLEYHPNIGVVPYSHYQDCENCDYISADQKCLTMAGLPGESVYCTRCGQEVIIGGKPFYITLPNGLVLVSNSEINFIEMCLIFEEFGYNYREVIYYEHLSESSDDYTTLYLPPEDNDSKQLVK